MNKIKTLHELAKENPDKTYNELTRIQEDARLEKEGVCVTAALKKDIKGTTFEEERKKFKKEIDYHRYWKDMYEREHKLRQEAQGETTIVKGIGMSSPEMKEAQQKIKELEAMLRCQDYTKQHDYKFLVDENKKLHKEVDELRRDNKILAYHVENQMDRTRKAGM